MFDIGFWELAFIGVMALLILGPKRLPEAARSAGLWIGKLRTFIANVKQDLDSQLRSDELIELRRLKDELLRARDTLQQTSESVVSSITDGVTSMGDQMQEVAPGYDFIDAAVSASLPANSKQSGSKKKARRKNGKPAVAKKRKTVGKKTGKNRGVKKKVNKKKSASKSKPTKTKVKSKKSGR